MILHMHVKIWTYLEPWSQPEESVSPLECCCSDDYLNWQATGPIVDFIDAEAVSNLLDAISLLHPSLYPT